MAIKSKNINPKSSLRHYYVNLSTEFNSANTDLSSGHVMCRIIPMNCVFNRASFTLTNADATGSNGVGCTIANVSRSANLFTTSGVAFQSQGSTVDVNQTDWEADSAVLYRSASSTFPVSAGSLISVTISATVGTATISGFLDFLIQPIGDTELGSNYPGRLEI